MAIRNDTSKTLIVNGTLEADRFIPHSTTYTWEALVPGKNTWEPMPRIMGTYRGGDVNKRWTPGEELVIVVPDAGLSLFERYGAPLIVRLQFSAVTAGKPGIELFTWTSEELEVQQFEPLSIRRRQSAK